MAYGIEHPHKVAMTGRERVQWENDRAAARQRVEEHKARVAAMNTARELQAETAPLDDAIAELESRVVHVQPNRGQQWLSPVNGHAIAGPMPPDPPKDKQV